jgi:glucose-6-phosphate-specific signal transduction histidine kinase
MKAQAKEGEKNMDRDVTKEMQDEMVGVLTAISIVSKRLANRLLQLEEQKEKEVKVNE